MMPDWLEAENQEEMQVIWCEDPETNTEKIAGNFLEKSYITYRLKYIRHGSPIVGMKYRYSEFETVRNGLRGRYFPYGIYVPPVPPKLITIQSKNTEQTLVKSRNLGLTLFCENVAASPWLRNDSQWKTFVRATNEPFTPDANNIGETQLLNYFRQLDIPNSIDMAERFEVIKMELKIIEQQVKSLVDKAKAIEIAERGLYNAFEAYSKQLDTWKQAEKEHINVLAGRVFEDSENILHPHEVVTTAIDNMSHYLRSRQEHSEDDSMCTTLTLIALLEFEQGSIQALQELIHFHDDTVKEIDTYQHKIRNNTKNEKKCEEWKKLIEEKQIIIQQFLKGFYFFSIPLFVRQRALYIRRFFSGKIVANQSITYHLFKATQEYFIQMKLSAEEVMEESARMLQVLKVKPMIKLPYESIEDNSRRVISTGKLNPIQGSNLFLSPETRGLTGIFEKAMTITQNLSGRGKNSADLLSSVLSQEGTGRGSAAGGGSNSLTTTNTTTYSSFPTPPPPPPVPKLPPPEDDEDSQNGFEEEEL